MRTLPVDVLNTLWDGFDSPCLERGEKVCQVCNMQPPLQELEALKLQKIKNKKGKHFSKLCIKITFSCAVLNLQRINKALWFTFQDAILVKSHPARFTRIEFAYVCLLSIVLSLNTCTKYSISYVQTTCFSPDMNWSRDPHTSRSTSISICLKNHVIRALILVFPLPVFYCDI